MDQSMYTPLMLLAVFGIMYFMIIRPNQKKQKEQQAKINAVKRGDKIITASGIHGTIYDLDEKTVTLTVASSTQIIIERSAISIIKE